MWIIIAVMAGRLLLSLFLQTAPGRRVLARFDGGNDGVYVRPPGYKTRLRWILPLIRWRSRCCSRSSPASTC